MAKNVTKNEFEVEKKRIEELEKLVADLVSKVKALELSSKLKDEKIDELEKKLNNHESVGTQNKELWSTMAAKNAKKSNEQLKVINVVAEESRARDKKENNIVIFGLKESEKENVTEKKNDDDELLKKVFWTINVQPSHLTMFRLKDKETSKPKPLVIVLKDKNERNKILAAARKLKGTEYDKIFFSPDLTESQRLAFKELVAERKKLNDERTEAQISQKIYYAIRDNKVVKLMGK